MSRPPSSRCSTTGHSVAESPAFRSRGQAAPPDSGAARRAYDELRAELERLGWEDAAEPGPTWYTGRFTRLVSVPVARPPANAQVPAPPRVVYRSSGSSAKGVDPSRGSSSAGASSRAGTTRCRGDADQRSAGSEHSRDSAPKQNRDHRQRDRTVRRAPTAPVPRPRPGADGRASASPLVGAKPRP